MHNDIRYSVGVKNRQSPIVVAEPANMLSLQFVPAH